MVTTLLWPKILNMHRLYCAVRRLRISVRQLSCLSRIGCFTHTSRTTHTLKVGWLKLSYTSQLKLSYTSYQSFYCLWRHIGSDSLCEGLIAVHDQLHMRNLNTCQQASLFIQAMQTSTLRVVSNKSHLATDLKCTSLSIRCRCWRELVSRCSVN